MTGANTQKSNVFPFVQLLAKVNLCDSLFFLNIWVTLGQSESFMLHYDLVEYNSMASGNIKHPNNRQHVIRNIYYWEVRKPLLSLLR